MSADNDAKLSPLTHGLLSQAGLPIPLKEISVDIKIIGFVAEATSSLLYTNNEEIPIEAEFTFPVDDGSAVFRFEAEIEGRHIVAEIQEKEQAKLTYQDAIEKGSTAMLLKEDDTAGDIFQCTLGNLPPKTDAKISFSYAIELPQEPDGKVRFTLPTVLNPRYSPDVGGTVSAEGATYSSPAKIPYKFSVVANVRGYHKVISVTSTHDKLKVEPLDDSSTSVSLTEDFKFDHDLSFLVEYENCYTPQVVLETGNPEAAGIMKEDLLMVNFYPKLDGTTTTSAGEYIFVIDRSGSMGGNRIKNAKEALFLFLKSLPTECYFNVISFGSSYNSLFKLGSSQYTKSNLKDALALQEKMDADMGGTEILEPFKHIMSKKVIKGHPRQIILLTDGEVSNTDKLIGLVKSNAHNTRVFTLGIGSGVSTSLIKGVARAGNGKAEFIADKDRIQPKVISLLKCATQAAVSNIELKWELPKEITAVPIPKQPPTFIGVGERLCLYALLTGGTMQSSDSPSGVKLTGESDGKPVDYKMLFSVMSGSAVNQSAPLHRLAAKVQIKTLETEEAEAFAEGAYGWSDNPLVTDIRQNMILVSQSANIVSKMTAFVAVDKEAQKRVEGEMVKRSCPVPVATEEFSDALRQDNNVCYSLCSGSSSLCKSVQYQSKSRSGLFSKMGNLLSKKKGKPFSASPEYMAAPASRPLRRAYCQEDCLSGDTDLFEELSDAICDAGDIEGDMVEEECLYSDDKMLEMVGLQEIEGYWPLTKNVTTLLDVSEETLKSVDIVKDTDVITTLAVIVWLRSKFSKRHDEWEMIEKKALTWLSSKTDKQKSLDELLEEIKQKLWPSGL